MRHLVDWRTKKNKMHWLGNNWPYRWIRLNSSRRVAICHCQKFQRIKYSQYMQLLHNKVVPFGKSLSSSFYFIFVKLDRKLQCGFNSLCLKICFLRFLLNIILCCCLLATWLGYPNTIKYNTHFRWHRCQNWIVALLMTDASVQVGKENPICFSKVIGHGSLGWQY